MALIHKFKQGDNFFVLDVNTGAVHIVDELVYDLVDDNKLRDKEELIKEFGAKYGEETISEAYEEILELIDEDILYSRDQYEDIAHSSMDDRDYIKAVCLNIIHGCNLRCKYCFADEGEYNGHKGVMSVETAKKAIDYVVKRSGPRRNIEIDLFGGEPTMIMDKVKEIIAYARENEKAWNKNIRFTMTTNATLLTEEMMDFMDKEMGNIILSLDGRKEVNDNMRPTVNDKGSYDVIMPKFKKLVEKRDKDKYYYIRGTFTRDNLDFGEDVLHFADEGFASTSVEPVVGDESNPYALRKEDMEKVFAEYEKLAKKYAKRKLEGENFTFFHFVVDLNQGPCVIKRITGCGAGNEYLAVTPNGDIYPCHQFVGNDDFRLANIMDEEVVIPQEISDMFRDAHVYSKEDCKTCWNKFYCSGGCHANAINFNNDIRKPYELGCEMQKKRTECSIMIQAKLMLEGE